MFNTMRVFFRIQKTASFIHPWLVLNVSVSHKWLCLFLLLRKGTAARRRIVPLHLVPGLLNFLTARNSVTVLYEHDGWLCMLVLAVKAMLFFEPLELLSFLSHEFKVLMGISRPFWWITAIMTLLILNSDGHSFVLLFLWRLLLPCCVISELDIIPAYCATFERAVGVHLRGRVIYFGIPGARQENARLTGFKVTYGLLSIRVHTWVTVWNLGITH